jgi:DNA-binding MarR family transcriptional regulator
MAQDAIPDESSDDSLPVASPFGDLTAFQLDILLAVPRADEYPNADLPHGLAIKEFLTERRDEMIRHGRLYPNMDELAERGFLRKSSIDDRTNGYELTGRGEERVFAVLSEAHDAVDAFGDETDAR